MNLTAQFTAFNQRYATICVMKRIMVYLPEDDAINLKRLVQQTGRSQVELIREGVAAVLAKHKKASPAPIGIVSSGPGDLADNAEEYLWSMIQKTD